ncbi:diguanylate cyclase [Psychrosphaera sp.]|nr:diguanylate cyclase [Psychrosphaera sp.]
MKTNFSSDTPYDSSINSANIDSVYRLGFDHIAVGIAVVSLSGKFIKINQQLCEILGYSYNELIDLTFEDLTMPEDIKERLAWSKSVLAGNTRKNFIRVKRYRHKLGHLVWAKLTASLVRDDRNQPSFYIFSLQDILELKETENALDVALVKLRNAYKEIDKLSSVDVISAAQKYESVKKHINFCIEQFRRHKVPATLIITNIDQLKSINTSYGKEFGDRALRAVASRLLDEVRSNDSVARYFEDEFIVVLPNTEFRPALDYIQRVNSDISFRLADGSHKPVELSIGASQLAEHIENVNDWVHEAKTIMLEHKKSKKPAE